MCQLHRNGVLHVKHLKSKKSLLQFIDLELLPLNCLTCPEALGPPEELSFASRFKKKVIIQFYRQFHYPSEKKIIL